MLRNFRISRIASASGNFPLLHRGIWLCPGCVCMQSECRPVYKNRRHPFVNMDFGGRATMWMPWLCVKCMFASGQFEYCLILQKFRLIFQMNEQYHKMTSKRKDITMEKAFVNGRLKNQIIFGKKMYGQRKLNMSQIKHRLLILSSKKENNTKIRNFNIRRNA